MLTNAAHTRGGFSPADNVLAPLVDSIGEDSFALALANFLHVLCGADHFAAFRLGNDELRKVAACCVQPERTAVRQVESYIEGGMWKHDPAVYEARRCMMEPGAAIIHIDLNDKGYSELRARMFPQVRDRMLLCARNASGVFGLSVLRTEPHSPFENDAGKKLSDKADLLIALLSKHAEVASTRPNVAQALTDLRDIESCIDVMGDLPRRESEVCSRILYGMSSVGIAIDLSISEETVKTYRKRAYLRLEIGCERELLTWYLGCWSRWRMQPTRWMNDTLVV